MDNADNVAVSAEIDELRRLRRARDRMDREYAQPPELVGETPSRYRAANHEALRVVPDCQTMILTRPRRG